MLASSFGARARLADVCEVACARSGALAAALVDGGLRIVALLAHEPHAGDLPTEQPQLELKDLALFPRGVQHIALQRDAAPERFRLFAVGSDGALYLLELDVAAHAISARATVAPLGPPRVLLPAGRAVRALACGARHVLAAAASQIYSWGEGCHGALGHGGLDDEPAPRALVLPLAWIVEWRVTKVAAGGEASACVLTPRDSGEPGPRRGGVETAVLAWGTGAHLGVAAAAEPKRRQPEPASSQCVERQLLRPTEVCALRAEQVLDLSLGDSHALAVTLRGTAFSWGVGTSGELGEFLPSADDVAGAAASVRHRPLPARVRGLGGEADARVVNGWCGAAITFVALEERAGGLELVRDAVYLWGCGKTGRQHRIDDASSASHVVGWHAARPPAPAVPDAGVRWLALVDGDGALHRRNCVIRELRHSERRYVSQLCALQLRLSRCCGSGGHPLEPLLGAVASLRSFHESLVASLTSAMRHEPLAHFGAVDESPPSAPPATSRLLDFGADEADACPALPPRAPAHVHVVGHCFLGLARALRHAHLQYASILAAAAPALTQHAAALEHAAHAPPADDADAAATPLFVTPARLHTARAAPRTAAGPIPAWRADANRPRSAPTHRLRQLLRRSMRGPREQQHSTEGPPMSPVLTPSGSALILEAQLSEAASGRIAGLAQASEPVAEDTQAPTPGAHGPDAPGPPACATGERAADCGDGEGDAMETDELTLLPWRRLGQYPLLLGMLHAATAEEDEASGGSESGGKDDDAGGSDGEGGANSDVARCVARVRSDCVGPVDDTSLDERAARGANESGGAWGAMRQLQLCVDGMYAEAERSEQLSALLRTLALSASDALGALFTPSRRLRHSSRGAIVKCYSIGHAPPELAPLSLDGQLCLLFSDCLLAIERAVAAPAPRAGRAARDGASRGGSSAHGGASAARGGTARNGRTLAEGTAPSRWQVVFRISLSQVSDIVRLSAHADAAADAAGEVPHLLQLRLRPEVRGGVESVYALCVPGVGAREQWFGHLVRCVGVARASPQSAPKVTLAGGEYTGQWRDGKQHGTGRAVFADGSEYDGEWAGGHASGSGTLRFAECADVYVGQFAQGSQHGVGALTCGRGDTKLWVGEWRHGLRAGAAVVQLRGGDLMLSDAWSEQAFGRSTVCGGAGASGGFDADGGVGSRRAGWGAQHWLHIERTLTSREFEQLCRALDALLSAWVRCCDAADALGSGALTTPSSFDEFTGGVNRVIELVTSVYAQLLGPCELSVWPHAHCEHLRQCGVCSCVREMWEGPAERALFARCRERLQMVHARQMRLHDALLRVKLRPLREAADEALLRALRVEERFCCHTGERDARERTLSELVCEGAAALGARGGGEASEGGAMCTPQRASRRSSECVATFGALWSPSCGSGRSSGSRSGGDGVAAPRPFGEAVALLRGLEQLTTPAERVEQITRTFQAIEAYMLHANKAEATAIKKAPLCADSVLPALQYVLVRAELDRPHAEFSLMEAHVSRGRQDTVAMYWVVSLLMALRALESDLFGAPTTARNAAPRLYPFLVARAPSASRPAEAAHAEGLTRLVACAAERRAALVLLCDLVEAAPQQQAEGSGGSASDGAGGDPGSGSTAGFSGGSLMVARLLLRSTEQLLVVQDRRRLAIASLLEACVSAGHSTPEWGPGEASCAARALPLMLRAEGRLYQLIAELCDDARAFEADAARAHAVAREQAAACSAQLATNTAELCRLRAIVGDAAAADTAYAHAASPSAEPISTETPGAAVTLSMEEQIAHLSAKERALTAQSRRGEHFLDDLLSHAHERHATRARGRLPALQAEADACAAAEATPVAEHLRAEAELLGRHIVAVRGRKRTPAPSSTQAEGHDDTDEGVSFWYVLDPAQHLGLAPSVAVGASDSETAA